MKKLYVVLAFINVNKYISNNLILINFKELPIKL